MMRVARLLPALAPILALLASISGGVYAATHDLSRGRLYRSDLPTQFVLGGSKTFPRYTPVMRVVTLTGPESCTTPPSDTRSHWRGGYFQSFVVKGHKSRVGLCSWRFNSSVLARAVFSETARPMATLSRSGGATLIKSARIGNESVAYILSTITYGTGTNAVVFRRGNVVVTLVTLDTPFLSTSRTVSLARTINTRLR